MTSRTGGRLVAESLAALGAQAVFGVPGIHALPIWDGLRASELRLIGARTELCAGFAADGYARTSHRPAVLLLSTGPGALNALTALMEAASAHVPVVALASQIPGPLLGTPRGYLHKLDGQRDAFAAVVKHAERAQSAEEIPQRLAEAFAIAATPPSGPVFLEIPVDILKADAGRTAVATPAPEVRAGAPQAASIAEAARLLGAARRPVLWAGGGILRADARSQLQALAERLDAPVVTTFMGKGALGDEHPLAAGSGCDEGAVQALLAGADVVLAVGTELGADTTAQYELAFTGRLIHADVAPERIGASYPALALVGDAGLTLTALTEALMDAAPGAAEPGPARATAVRARISDGLADQGREDELGLLSAVQDGLPDGGVSTWDMTILAYWAAAHLRLRDGQRFHYPLGSGTLGYAWPAALGAAVAEPERRTLAVCGDGGLAYGLAELATARQHDLDATLLVVDDGGYGILREYQTEDFGRTVAVDLVQPDLAQVADAFGVPFRAGGLDTVAEHLSWAMATDGPAVVVVRARLAAPQPTA